MKTATYSVTLDVEVFDPIALRAAAKAEALKGMSAEDWEELRNSNFSPISADLHMLLDPGVSPPGCEIEHGEVIFLGGDDLEDQDADEPASPPSLVV